jgi:hypothetical protein
MDITNNYPEYKNISYQGIYRGHLLNIQHISLQKIELLNIINRQNKKHKNIEMLNKYDRSVIIMCRLMIANSTVVLKGNWTIWFLYVAGTIAACTWQLLCSR